MNIILLCNAGMSTGIMQMRLEEEAKKRNLAATVTAMPMSELDEVLDTADVVLLAPQIRFAEKQIKKQLPKATFCMVISSQDFGMMNAAKVLDQIQQALSL